MTDLAAKIAAKAEQATDTLNELRAHAVTLAASPTAAQDWASYANQLAEAEGAAYLWLGLQQLATHLGDKLTREAVTGCTFDVLKAGADDRWSGRGNDARRARFDGIRTAAGQVSYL